MNMTEYWTIADIMNAHDVRFTHRENSNGRSRVVIITDEDHAPEFNRVEALNAHLRKRFSAGRPADVCREESAPRPARRTGSLA